jgi:hypothetical protein
VDFDVLPGELLSQPVEARLARQPHGQLALGRFDFLVEEHVDAKRAYVGVPDRRVLRQVEPRAQQVSAEVGQPLKLREESFFAGNVVKQDAEGFPDGNRRQGEDDRERQPCHPGTTWATISAGHKSLLMADLTPYPLS